MRAREASGSATRSPPAPRARTRRLGVVARAKKDDKLRDELNATRRDREQARKEARDGGALRGGRG